MSLDSSLKDTLQKIRGEAHFNEPMWRHVSFRIGGIADALVVPHDLDDLKKIVSHAGRTSTQLTVVGGTNLLVRDGGIKGIVVSLQKFQEIKDDDLSHIYVGGGVRMPHLLNVITKRGYGGLEFAAGIPGTLAGSIVMNAGTMRGEMKDAIQKIHLLDQNGHLQVIQSEDLEFGYRCSSLPQGIVLGAWLKITPSSVKKVDSSIKALLRRRKQTQPLSLPSAGCIFRNPKGDSAGRLIEFSGFKGYRVGDAAISTVHANFAVNVGRATAKNVLSLISNVQAGVKEKTGTSLVLELSVMGRD